MRCTFITSTVGFRSRATRPPCGSPLSSPSSSPLEVRHAELRFSNRSEKARSRGWWRSGRRRRGARSESREPSWWGSRHRGLPARKSLSETSQRRCQTNPTAPILWSCSPGAWGKFVATPRASFSGSKMCVRFVSWSVQMPDTTIICLNFDLRIVCSS